MADAKSVPNPLATAAANQPGEKKVVFVNSPVPPTQSKSCLTSLLETDPDDLCAFRTIRTVNIQDRRLGILNLVFKILIFMYIVLQIVFLQAYRADGEIVGTLRLQLKEPDSSYVLPPSALKYCGSGRYPAGGRLGQQLTCTYDDALSAVFPEVEQTSTFLTTRLSREDQGLPDGCDNPSTLNCTYETKQRLNTYLAQPELFTLLIDHSVSAPALDISSNSFSMTGRLSEPGDEEGASGNGKAFDPCWAYSNLFDPPRPCPSSGPGTVQVGKTDSYDIVPLGSLLASGGVTTLDSIVGGTHPNDTKRFGGGIYVVSIEYDNYFTYFPSEIRYSYSVKPVLGVEFKAEEVAPAPGASLPNRTIFDRHGIRLLFSQGGRIGAFRATALLTQLVSSIGLLAVSAAIGTLSASFATPLQLLYLSRWPNFTRGLFFAVNFFAFNVLHMRFIYKQYANVDTVDFSDVSLDEAALKRFKTHDMINPRPAIFARAISMEERRAELLQRGMTLKAIEEEEEKLTEERAAAAGGVGGAAAGGNDRRRSAGRSVLNPLSKEDLLSSPRSMSSRSGRTESMQGFEMASTDGESEPEGHAPPETERTLSGNERVSSNWLPRPHKRNSQARRNR